MTVTFRPAVREKTHLLVGIAGPSGSGKTFSALRLATGIKNGGQIAMIDTEARHGLHYADRFSYLYAELKAPFSPDRYLEAMRAAQAAGASVIIVDSMSHAHEGPGGLLEMHESELDRMAGSDYRKREAVKFSAWIEPKKRHNQFVNAVLQMDTHVIFCFRAKEKLKMVRNEKGRMEPIPMGWQPICSDRFEYEMAALLMLPPNSGGVPDLNAGATKMQAQHRAIFDSGSPIDEEMGKKLAQWAEGQQTGPDTSRLDDEGTLVAQNGTEAFRAWWKNLSRAERDAMKQRLDEFKDLAERADARMANETGAEEAVLTTATGAAGEGDAQASDSASLPHENEPKSEPLSEKVEVREFDVLRQTLVDAETKADCDQVMNDTKEARQRWSTEKCEAIQAFYRFRRKEKSA